MKLTTASTQARPGFSGPEALTASSHGYFMPPPKPLRRILTGLTAALAVLGLSQPAAHANSTPYFFDVDGGTAGFGAPSGTYSLAPSGASWSPDSTGTSTTIGFPGRVQMTFGETGTDFDGAAFTVNFGGDWFWLQGLAVNSSNAHITLAGGNLINNYGGNPVTSWYVATGSTLDITGNYGGIGGMNWGGYATSLTGGGTFNFVTVPGLNAGGTLIEINGPVVNLKAAVATGSQSWDKMANFTLTVGTLNFATAASAGAFNLYGNNSAPWTINGGTIDNTSGSAMTLDLKGGYAGQGIIKLGGDFTFTGSSNLSFGTAPVTLTATSQITVTEKNLAIDGIIDGSIGLGITKAGAGTLTLTGLNSYTGNTTLNEGVLSIANPYLDIASTVAIASSGATLDLTFTGTNTVAALIIGGSPQADGVYGAIGSAAQHPIAQITGSGRLKVSSAVGAAESTIAMVRNSNTAALSTLGDSLSFDVTVSGNSGIPSGKVILKDAGSSGTTIGTGTLTPSGTDGFCTITTTDLTQGTHSNIVAVYDGDSTYATSTSSALDPAQVVYPVNLKRPYLDTDGATAGFQSTDGATYNFSDKVWNSQASGIGPLGAFSFDGANPAPTLTIGTAADDFAGQSFTINANNSGFWWIYNGIAINGSNVHVTLSGANLLNADVVGETWSVATESSLTVNGNYGGIGGLNWGGGANGVTFTGGGTFNFVTSPGMAAAGRTITQSGPVVNMKASSGAGGFGNQANYTLSAGTLNFASVAAARAFVALGGNYGMLTISGGTIDNTSGLAMTLDLLGSFTKQGAIKLGGDFTFAGSSDLSFGSTPVTLAATPQITVTANVLTVGGTISGGAFGLTKAGDGTLTLAAPNTYTGPTTIAAGVLECGDVDALGSGDLSIATAAKINLNYSGNKTIASLTLGGASKSPGVYDKHDPSGLITGDGMLTVSSGTAGSYATWAAGQTPPLGDASAMGPDGLSNLLIYALAGLKTDHANGSPGTLTNKVLSFNKRTDAVTNGDVTYTIETSPDLQNSWTPVSPDLNDATTISYTLPAGHGKIFARLVVTQN